MTEACDLSATEARSLIGRKALSPSELLASCVARIAAVNPAVNAIVTMDVPAAQAAARAVEAAQARGEALGPLAGLPLGIKDMEETAGLRTTWGSPDMADHVPAQDHLMVARLRGAGGIILAKTNVPQFGLGANTRNAVFGATGNAFAPALNAAGSSGGSAVALACGMVPLASGSDVAGSLRTPAAYNGVVGYRPSPGLVPNDRNSHGWSPLPVLGPMARNVADLRLMLSAMAGDAAADPLAHGGHALTLRGPEDLSGLRVAFTEDFGHAPVEPAIRARFREVVAALAPLLAEAVEATPDVTGGDEAFEVLRGAGVLTAHAERVRLRPQACGPNMRANVADARRYTLADFARASACQTAIYRGFQGFFGRHQVLLTPMAAFAPRPWRELAPMNLEGQPLRGYFHWLALAYYVTLTGHPAISLPAGVDANGMPFGLQIVGPRGGDGFLLAVAAALEAVLPPRPIPDLAKLRQAPPISEMEGFLGFG